MIETNKSIDEKIVQQQVKQALAEDLGAGDITASLLPAGQIVKAALICREKAIICGQMWVNEVFRQVDDSVQIHWLVAEGQTVDANDVLLQLTGLARSVVTAERTALNFLQTLSATATVTAQYVEAVKPYGAHILDTRKTIPGWRLAQKYAVTIGGGVNHRFGLYDAYLIKENHIAAAGSIYAAAAMARRQHPDKPLIIEVEDLEQLQQALLTACDRILLDNFTIEQCRQAVQLTFGKCKLEISGNIDLATAADYASTGVDYLSVGALTKHIQAVDLSLRMQNESNEAIKYD